MKIIWKKEIKASRKISDKDIVSLILNNRNIRDQAAFLNPPHPRALTMNEFGYGRQLSKTLALLESIRKAAKTIVICTDYDADGITGGAIVWETLHMLGFKVMPYVPHRKTEGYGFSVKALDAIKKEYDPELIISVDHGISARKQIEYATSLGIKIIVTDHHLKPNDPPDKAEGIFHIPELSGSGVGYVFAKELFDHFKKTLSEKNRTLLEAYFNTDYLALASIGTVADLVPLTGPSRSIVFHGLKAFAKIKRKGIRHILKQAGIEDKTITPYEIGYVIAPRINAVGRLGHAIDALRLLCTTDDIKAHKLASKVGNTNKERQDLVDAAVKQAIALVEHMKQDSKLPKLIVLHDKNWNEGIIGLIASKITDAYSRPTIVMTKSDDAWKGSARSFNAFHITDFLRSFNKDLLSVGGHKLAAGFSIDELKISAFIRQAQKKADALLHEKDLEKIIDADLYIPLSKIHMPLAKELETLAPFGMGNPYPLFVSNALVLDRKLFGKKNEHVKLLVKDDDAYSFPLEMIAFYKASEYEQVLKGQLLTIAYELGINEWNGKRTLRGKVILINKFE